MMTSIDNELKDEIINVAKLNEAFMNDSGIIKQILSAFQETISGFEENFNQLNDTENVQELSRLVHGLKGSSANIRAEKLAKQAARVQQLIDKGEHYMQETQALFDAIK